MADKIGATFAARISGVTRFGLFVTLLETGASGLVPISSLVDDFWMHDEAAQALIGQRTRGSYRLAQRVEVRLVEATPLTGGLLFEVCSASTVSAHMPVRRPASRSQAAGRARGRGKPGP